MARLNKTWTSGERTSALATELHKALEVSHRQAKGIIDAGCVRINGEVARTHGQRLKEGDVISVSFDPATAYQELPPPKTQLKEIGFEILWEDKHLIFVNKPAGLLTVPSESGKEGCLAEAITEHYQRRGFKRFQLYIVHRLDRFSSGVLVFAKTPEALHGLKKMFESHHLNRVYKAILVGEIPENAGTLTGKLVEHAKTLRMSVVQSKGKSEPKGAKHAITHYRVLERLPGHTVVEVRLETGRRNQIRVQFADRGYPLLGDQVYGEVSPILDRQALHAELLGFRHPVTDESLTVSAILPQDMERALKILRTQRRVERAEAGVQGEEGIYKPKINKARKFERVQRAERFSDPNSGAKERGQRARGEIGRDEREERPRSFRPRPEGEERRPDARGPRTARPGVPPSAPPRGDREGQREERPRTFRPRPEGEERRPESRGPRTVRPQGDREGQREDRPRTSRPRPEGEDRRPAARGPRPERPERSSSDTRSRSAKPGDRSKSSDRPRSGAPRTGRPSGPGKPGRPAGKPAGKRGGGDRGGK